MFSTLEREHYSRHLRLKGFGEEKQLRLKSARVLLIGAGGLGCPVAMYLAAAGVGTIGIADADAVERSNLHRQVAHSVGSLGLPKVHSIIAMLQGLNPFITFVPHSARLTGENIAEIIAGYDLVVDGSDNFTTRFLAVDACYLLDIPLLQGAVYGYEGQFSLFVRGEGGCMRCLFEAPPTEDGLAACHEVGVLGVVPGAVGLLMATEAIHFLTGMPTPSKGKLLRYSACDLSLKHYTIARNRQCPLCGEHAGIHEVKEEPVSCITAFPEEWETTFAVMQQKQAVWLDVREEEEFNTGHLPDGVHFALSRLQKGEMPDVPCGSEIVVYCQTGRRSRKAVTIVRAHGFTRCYSLIGGLNSIREQA